MLLQLDSYMFVLMYVAATSEILVSIHVAMHVTVFHLLDWLSLQPAGHVVVHVATVALVHLSVHMAVLVAYVWLWRWLLG